MTQQSRNVTVAYCSMKLLTAYLTLLWQNKQCSEGRRSIGGGVSEARTSAGIWRPFCDMLAVTSVTPQCAWVISFSEVKLEGDLLSLGGNEPGFNDLIDPR